MTSPISYPPVSSILIVEDEGLIAAEIKEGLTKLGFDVIGTADTAGKAIHTAACKHPDLVLAISRHRLEQQLKESEVRFRATLKSIGDGVISTDDQGRVTFMNPPAEALTGWNLHEAEGEPVENVLTLIDEASQTPMENPIRRVLREGTTVFCGPAQLLGRDTQSIPIENSAAPIVTEDGKTIGAVIAMKDIRERRRAEQALHQTQEQLRQSQKMESLGRLIGGIAHDFNNLLTVINGYSKLLLHRGDLDSDAAGDIRDIADAGDRAATLVHQLMAFSRGQIIMPRVLDLNNLVRNTEKLLGRLIGEDIRLAMNLHPAELAVQVDPGQLEQVIVNLAVNARDAMPQGGELTIETDVVNVGDVPAATRPELQPGRWVMLSVTDSGCGMDEWTKTQIFEPFFTSKDAAGGTGLGLATAHGIVTQSGGFIYVCSEPGMGARFDICLPAVERPILPETQSEESASSPHGDETILLVEDEAPVRAICASVLRSFGYTVLVAESSEETIRICERYRWPIHLLVTDVVLPRMNGSKLASRVSAMIPGIKVLYMSGYTDDKVVRQGVVEGKAVLIQKPFTQKKLSVKVREILDLPLDSI